MKPIHFKVYIQPASDNKWSMSFIEIPPGITEQFLSEKENKKRVIVNFKNGKKVHRALQRNKDGFCYIITGKLMLKEAKLEPRMTAEISLVIDDSEFGMPFPEELLEVFHQMPEAEKVFLDLTDGLQRSFLYYIHTAKTVETRIQRSLRMAENFENGIISAGKQ